VGLTLFLVVRQPVLRALWLAWPAWVAFAVLATGNHYWLDIAAGILIAALSALALRPDLGSLRRA
jgi:membrane-associated phospholipid phosphatase